jgi:hypothetical protein
MFLMIGSCLIACNGTAKERVDGQTHAVPGQHINEAGEYLFDDCGLRLSLRTEEMLVSFSLQDTMGNILFRSGKPSISALHRWSMSVDDSCILHIRSSDIGPYRLERVSGTGEYVLSVDSAAFGLRPVSE